jgi:lysophospholipase L1-like esterase
MFDNHTLTRWILFGFFILVLLLGYSLWDNSVVSTPRPQSNEEIEAYLAQNKDSLGAELLDPKKVDSSQIVDTRPQLILFIGDSMAQGLEIPLKKYAEFNKHQFTTIAKQSATIISWVGSDSSGRLRKTLQEIKPTYLIICLGANELMTTGLTAYEGYLQNILKQAGNTKLIWVGPPNWREDNGLTDLIAKEMGKGRYFSSKDLTLPRAGDKIHPTYQGYFAWADTLTQWIREESRHKILLEKPEVPPVDTLKTPSKAL